MSPPFSKESSSPSLPEHASVVVIGGGVMGCSTLYHLAESGVSDAILLERNQLTSGTTWHSAAQVRALRSTRNLTDLIRYSVDLYSRLEAETGQSVGWIQKGSLSIATNPDRMVHVKRQQSLARLFGVQADSMSADEALERWPLMNASDVLGAVWSPDDGRVSPSDLCAALVKGAKSRGAKIFENTGVTGILTENNKVIGVETDQGTIRCDAIALCTGLWSKKAAKMANVDIPIWPCEHFYLLTKSVDGIQGNMPTLSDHDGHLYIRDDSGGLLVGCFEPMGKAIDPDRLGEDFAFGLLDEDWDHFEPMMENAMHRLPVLADCEVKMLLNGPESFTPDGSFLLGETGETKGLFLGCGMNSVGVATGGGAGMALAHCILHGHTPTDLHEAHPQRFPDCFNSAAALAERVPEVLGKHYEITYPGRQWETSRSLVQLPLHQCWQESGAYFGQVYGYERAQYFGCNEHPELQNPTLSFGKPAWFDQVGREVKQATETAALFDQSTFGKFDVKGEDACAFLNRVCANQMDREIGRAIYTAMLNEQGGMISDLTAIRIASDNYRLFVGTAARKHDWNWLRRNLTDGEDVILTDRTDEFMIIALMGPDSPRIATEVGAQALNDIAYFGHADVEIAGKAVHAVRLSFVGETGWEISCRQEDATVVYDALFTAGAHPAGLLAQSAMRIEKGYLAYGHDLDTDLSPLESGLEFAVAWETDFIGKEALLTRKQAPLEKKIVSIVLDETEAVPLGNEPVVFQGEMCGKTTSAAFGYRVGKPIAIALVDSKVLSSDGLVHIDIAGELFSGQAQEGPVFDPHGVRMKSTV